MPEGDSLRNIAAALTTLVAGATVESLITAGVAQPALAGQRIAPPAARGKHLLMPIGPRAVLHVHHGLHGAWHAYPVGAPWRLPAHRAAIVLRAGGHVLPCFDPMQVELLEAGRLEQHPALSPLGPHLLDTAPDLDEVLARARRCRAADVAGVLLDQRVAAGIGNIYKSETLFLSGTHPWTRPAALSDAALQGLFALASHKMKGNVRPGLRTLTSPRVLKRTGQRLWVYQRRGQPCLRCTRPIRCRNQGAENRITFWCPACQPLPADPAPGWRPM